MHRLVPILLLLALVSFDLSMMGTDAAVSGRTSISSSSSSSSSSNTNSNAISMGDALEKRLMTILTEMRSQPVLKQCQGGNIEVRTKWDGNCMISMSEAKCIPHHPNKIRAFLKDFNASFPKVNPMAQCVTSLTSCHDHSMSGHEEQEAYREGVKSVLKFPFPLTDRLMIHWKYPRLDRAPNEHLLLLSEQDNEELLANHYTKEEKKRYVLGRTFLCAYWVQPVHDNEQKIIGSNIKYVFSGDTGGSIPKWVQDKVGPQTAMDSIRGLIDHIEKEE